MMCPENFTEKSTDNKLYMVAPKKVSHYQEIKKLY